MNAELRRFLIDLVSDLLVASSPPARDGSRCQRNERASPNEPRHMSEGCTDSQPVSCSSKSLYECNPQNGENRFFCRDDPSDPVKAFDCAYHWAFTCTGDKFDCTGEFTCSQQNQFHCDADMFECSSYTEDSEVGKFDCSGGGGKNFDCTDGKTFDFMCDRSPWPPGAGQGYECDTIPQQFDCLPKHIFKCYSTFDCPTTHTCRPPKRTCPQDSEKWEPPSGDRDDGSAGDFDCSDFTCGASSPGNPQQKFDCGGLGEEENGPPGPSSDFKCLDRMEGSFDCGQLSEFECGEEGERFVCFDYECEANFRCESAFHCGNKDEQLGYECRPQFQCVAEAGTNPDEVGYACDEAAGSFICERYNCDPESYDCNPPDEFKCAQVFSP